MDNRLAGWCVMFSAPCGFPPQRLRISRLYLTIPLNLVAKMVISHSVTFRFTVVEVGASPFSY